MKKFVPKIEVLKRIEEMEVIRPFGPVDYLDMTKKAAEMRVYRLQKRDLLNWTFCLLPANSIRYGGHFKRKAAKKGRYLASAICRRSTKHKLLYNHRKLLAQS